MYYKAFIKVFKRKQSHKQMKINVCISSFNACFYMRMHIEKDVYYAYKWDVFRKWVFQKELIKISVRIKSVLWTKNGTLNISFKPPIWRWGT